MYSLGHILIISSLILISTFIAIIFKKNDKVLNFSLLFLFLLEMFRVIFLVSVGNFRLNSSLSFQLCFTYAFIGLIYLFSKKKYFLDYLGPFGILFAIFAIVLTDPTKLFSFNVIDCYVYHSVLLYIGVYITKNYSPVFTFKSIGIFWVQIILAFLANVIVKNGANYVFLNSLLKPSYRLKYCINIEAFNIPFFNGLSVNDILIGLVHRIGFFYYDLVLILIVTIFLTVWLRIFSKKATQFG